MKGLGKKLLEAAKESNSTLAKMIVDGKYKTDTSKEKAETKRKPKFSKKHKKSWNQKRFPKSKSVDTPEVIEVKSKP